MRPPRRLYLRALAVSALILGCLGLFIAGLLTAYSRIRAEGFADYRPPVQITRDSIKILDFEF